MNHIHACMPKTAGRPALALTYYTNMNNKKFKIKKKLSNTKNLHEILGLIILDLLSSCCESDILLRHLGKAYIRRYIARNVSILKKISFIHDEQ